MNGVSLCCASKCDTEAELRHAPVEHGKELVTACFIFKGRRQALQMEVCGVFVCACAMRFLLSEKFLSSSSWQAAGGFGGDKLLERLADIFDIALRNPANPYGKILYLVHSNSQEVSGCEQLALALLFFSTSLA